MSDQLPELWKHQKEAIKKAGLRYALFFDPGTGKTRTAIELIHKYNVGQGQKIIVFAPLNVCRNWQKELAKYLRGDFGVSIVAGQSTDKKLQIINTFAKARADRLLFLVCNIESLRSKYYQDALACSGAEFFIIDESHNFKTPTSIQTKGLFNIERILKPRNLYLLTGTPAPQGEMDLWTTFVLLKRCNDSFFVWRKKNFTDRNERRRGTKSYWPDYVVTPKAKLEFQKLLAECSMSAKKDEVLDLPPLLRTTIYAEMSPEQKRHYETMEEFLFAIDEKGNELNASNLLVRTLRLQQILAGLIGDVPIKNNPRLQALDAAIEKTNDEQFIVWTIFAPTYVQIADLLHKKGIKYGFATGEQSPKERDDYREAFERGEIRAIIGHPKAGGVGVEMTAASYSIHYTRSYNLVDDLQSEARNYRGGSERHKRITRIDIVTPDTIDEEITEALASKKSVQDFILGLHGRRKTNSGAHSEVEGVGTR